MFKIIFKKKITFNIILLFIISTVFLFSTRPYDYNGMFFIKHENSDRAYLAHGFTLGLNFDLKYERLLTEHFWHTKKENAAPYPIGPGLLASPFIALFSVMDRINYDPVIKNHLEYQYSWSIFGFVFATVFYFLGSLYLNLKAINAIGIYLDRMHFILFSASYGILYYVLGRPLSGPGYEAFTLAICLWGSCKSFYETSNGKINFKYIFISALGIVLTLQVRPSDINALILPIIVYSFTFTMEFEKYKKVINQKIILQTLFLFLFSFIVLYSPFAFLNYHFYEMIYPSSDAMYGVGANPVPKLHSMLDYIITIKTLIYRLPKILVILFSSEFGLLYSSASLFFGTLLIIFLLLNKIKKQFYFSIFTLVCLFIYISIPFGIVLLFQSRGTHYAFRFLFSIFPIALLGYAYWQFTLKNMYQSYFNYPFKSKFVHCIILILCSYGILAELFFGATNELMNRQHINALGKQDWTVPKYHMHVIRALPNPQVWKKLFFYRTPKILLVDLTDKNSQNTIPIRAYIQILLLLAFFVIGLFWLSNTSAL